MKRVREIKDQGFLVSRGIVPLICQENTLIHFARTCAYLYGEMEIILWLTSLKIITKNC